MNISFFKIATATLILSLGGCANIKEDRYRHTINETNPDMGAVSEVDCSIIMDKEGNTVIKDDHCAERFKGEKGNEYGMVREQEKTKRIEAQERTEQVKAEVQGKVEVLKAGQELNVLSLNEAVRHGTVIRAGNSGDSSAVKRMDALKNGN